MIGVPINEPNTPPLLMVKVPPSISSTARSPFFAYNVNTTARTNYCEIMSTKMYAAFHNYQLVDNVYHTLSNPKFSSIIHA